MIQTILQWEANVILREEPWVFTSFHDVDTIVARITRPAKHSHEFAEQESIVIQLKGDQLSLKKRNNSLLRFLGIGIFLFSGKISPTSAGSRINGRFKMPAFSRFLGLLIINGFGIWWLADLSVLIYQTLILGDLTFTQEGTLNVFVVLLLGVLLSWLGYKFFGFLKYFERGNRQALETFLRRVTE